MNKISLNNISPNLQTSNYSTANRKKENSVQKAAIKQLPPKNEPMNWTKFAAIAVGSAAIALIAAKTFEHFNLQQPDPAGGETPPAPPEPPAAPKIDPEVEKQIQSLLDAAHLEENIYPNRDDKKVFESYLKAAELGSLEAQTYFGRVAYDHQMPGIQDQQAFRCEWRKKASDQGLQSAEQLYAWSLSLPTENASIPMYLRESCPLTKEGFSWMEQKAKNGNRDAQLRLSQLYSNGKTSDSFSVKPDLAIAFSYQKLAAEQGDSDSLYNVGLSYYKGEGVAKDSKVAFDYFEKSAKKENGYALGMLGDAYSKGYKEGDFEILASLPKAAEFFTRGASQGNPYCQYRLAFMHINGEGGLEKDLPKAGELLLKASRKRHLPSMKTLHQLYANKNVAEDPHLKAGLLKSQIEYIEQHGH